jgi:hypothetical protein
MALPENVKKQLLASSGGFCQNPSCNNNLFQLLADGKISNIYEGAHIVGEKTNGPRGKSVLTPQERDMFDNIILLCANCHTTVDKNPKNYTVDIMQKWKSEHISSIKKLFEVPKFSNRNDLKKELIKIFAENKSIFNEYGPFSDYANKSSISEASKMWTRMAISVIIPNNRKIENLLQTNIDLLSSNEMDIYYKFKIHREGFEFNKSSGDKNSDVTTFPQELYNILN